MATIDYAKVGTAILGQVPVDVQPEWVAYTASNYERKDGESIPEFIGRWWWNEQVKNPLDNDRQQKATAPKVEWSDTP